MTFSKRSEDKIPKISTSWLVLITLAILLMVGLFAILILRTEILLILFGGVFLGIAIKPAANWVGRLGIPKEVGAALIFISILALLGLFITLAFPLLAMQTVDLANIFSEGYSQFRESLLEEPNLLVFQLLQTLPRDIFQLNVMDPDSPDSEESEGGNGNTERIGSLLGEIVQAALGIIFVFFLAIHWATEGDRIVFTALLLSNQPREFLRETFKLIEKRVSRYLAGLGVLSLIIGTLSFIGYAVIGLPYALVLAIFAGIMEAIPVIGPTLGAIPAVFVALSMSPGAAVAVIILTILIQGVENIWLVSWVMGTSVEVPPFATLIVLLALSNLFGLPGALLAIPIAAVVQVIYESIEMRRRYRVDQEIGRDRISTLRYELKELINDIPLHQLPEDAEVKSEVEDIEDTLEAIALDLDAMLRQPNNGGQE